MKAFVMGRSVLCVLLRAVSVRVRVRGSASYSTAGG